MKKIRLHTLTFIFAVVIGLYYTQPRRVDWFFRTCVLMLTTVFVVRMYRKYFPGALTATGRIRYTIPETRCFYCKMPIPLYRRLFPVDYTSTGGNDYCSSSCARTCREEIELLAILRLEISLRDMECRHTLPTVSDPSKDELNRLLQMRGDGIPVFDCYSPLPYVGSRILVKDRAWWRA